ncbi:hypothetical protein [Trinickia sp.]|uniref:hypothetical protein n=1 Tax=Trinickia sp. TaxID=2571163 RepID=UPI003F7FF977
MSDQPVRNAGFTMLCANCDGEVIQPASFCQHCGARVTLLSGRFGAARDRGSDRPAPARVEPPRPVRVEAPAPARVETPPAARFEPPLRSFAPADFEGDLDAPPGSSADSPDASLVGARDGDAAGTGFLRWRQWGWKRSVGAVLASGVVLLGGLTVMHRYDEPAVSAATQDKASVSGDDGARSMAATGQIAPASAPNVTAPPVAGTDTGADTDVDTTKANTGKVEATPRSHVPRGRAHVRTRRHGHAKRWRMAYPNIYSHADAQLQGLLGTLS